MTRRPNTRATLIYWLIDTRPETIAAGWPVGKPFYCGKSVNDIQKRFSGHRTRAKECPERPISKTLTDCGEHVRIQIVETVPIGADWRERERSWIRLIRFCFPGNCNVSDGGEGTPGFVPNAEQRARMSAAHVGKKLSPQAIAKRVAKQIGAKRSDESRARMSVAAKARFERGENIGGFLGCRKGVAHTTETRAKLSEAHTGKPQHPNQRAGLLKANTGRPKTAAERAAIGAAHRGKIVSPETREKLRLAALRQHHGESANA